MHRTHAQAAREHTPNAHRWSLLQAAVASIAILALGGHTLASMSRLDPQGGAPPLAQQAGLGSPSTDVPAPGSDGAPQSAAEAELPSLMYGPPEPERFAELDPGPVRGPLWRLQPLPPAIGALPLAPGPWASFPGEDPEAAVPMRIVPRRRPGSGTETGETPQPVTPLPARPARSAETTAARPLSVRVSLSHQDSSPHGPGAWLKIRASGSAPCYVAVLHVDARRLVTLVFPKRFDLPYRPNDVYDLMVREEAPETAQFVVVIGSVYPLTAADALAALETQNPSAVMASDAAGPAASSAWEAVQEHLRRRADGASSLKNWERHAWQVGAAVRPARREPAETEPASKPDPESGAGTAPGTGLGGA